MKNFIEKLLVQINNRLGNNYSVRTELVTKNNGIKLQGLIITKAASNISPTIYLENYFDDYQNGKKIYDIATDIISVYQASVCFDSFDTSSILDFTKVKEQIYFTLVNTERNKNELKEIPHIQYLDFSIIFKILVDSNMIGTGSITIKNSLLKMWNIPLRKLCEIALKNTPYILPFNVKDIFQIISKEQEGFNPLHTNYSDFLSPMLILTNNKFFNGCSCILYPDVLSKIANAASVNSDLYILPSSIHETILLPVNGTADPVQLKHMVQEINREHVSPEEFLSDNIYYYSRQTEEIEIVAV